MMRKLPNSLASDTSLGRIFSHSLLVWQQELFDLFGVLCLMCAFALPKPPVPYQAGPNFANLNESEAPSSSEYIAR